MNISLFVGDTFKDHRGTLSFVNDFDMSEIKRFYTIVHPNTEIVRAWQGHQFEQKWFTVVQGSFKLAAVKIDDWGSPSPTLRPHVVTLTDVIPQVLHLPAGYANGFKALEPNSKIIVFSDKSLEDSKKDNYRFDSKLWLDW